MGKLGKRDMMEVQKEGCERKMNETKSVGTQVLARVFVVVPTLPAPLLPQDDHESPLNAADLSQTYVHCSFIA